MNNFSTNIPLLRSTKGKSQEECANDLGLTRTAWNNYEKGRSQPALNDLLRIAKYFDVTLTELVELDLTNKPGLVKKAKQYKGYKPADSTLKEPPASYFATAKILEKRVNILEKKILQIEKKIH